MGGMESWCGTCYLIASFDSTALAPSSQTGGAGNLTPESELPPQ
jgi:hypothetical protein